MDKWFAKTIIKTGIEGLIGESGVVREVDGIKAAKIHGDLYSFAESVPFEDGTPFVVKGVDGGTIIPEFKNQNN
ncbi:NfeD family protein [Butyrivibrio sp. INlla21]|uniref:NfeD family protein n=1 Tax=Butyrivibrio sp. INlla21 TaxID=1520811 RepID=UPI0008EFF56F|nr:NfeD family protein [Butyrivibrio sp. INlla21]SFU79897.1 hypothetical protein SAMN02910342_01798 [Butyrivibrio sp. INlla21]